MNPSCNRRSRNGNPSPKAGAPDFYPNRSRSILRLRSDTLIGARSGATARPNEQARPADAAWREVSSLGVPAALVLRATLDDCRKAALGQASRLRIGFLGGGLYELTLPFVRHLRSKFHIDVEWVELFAAGSV